MVVLKFNQDLYIGAWLIGVIVSTILFGILTIQCMFYLNRFKRDRWFFKALVLIVWSLDLIIISLGALWTYLAILRNFGDDSGVFRSAQWTIAPACVDISLNGFLVQLFFARRGYLLNRSLWMISLSAVILATLSFVSGITFTVIMRIVVQDHGSAVYAWLNYLWFTSAAATDLLVALIVVFSLGANSHSYSFHAKRGLRKLMIYTISNGILTSVVAVAGVVLAFVVPPSWIQPALSFVLARLYSNSLLASLQGILAMRHQSNLCFLLSHWRTPTASIRRPQRINGLHRG
ncbi:hypothetical protein DL93DRAFT_1432273 [Clavulina sp. PMI_390]|nr:hypothetical protein DL93DRAFT_1432273 [Clavulina sp. PMI_390]